MQSAGRLDFYLGPVHKMGLEQKAPEKLLATADDLAEVKQKLEELQKQIEELKAKHGS